MATKRQSQLKLTDCMRKTNYKRPATELSDLEDEEISDNESIQSTQSESEDELQSNSSLCNVPSLPLQKSACSAVCCTDLSKVYQPTSKETIGSLFNQRKFRPEWFKQYPWLTACLTKKRCFAYLADTFL